MRVSTIDLAVEQLAAGIAIDQTLFEKEIAGSKSEVSHYIDYLRHQIVLHFRKGIATETLDTITMSRPASWWQHFKRDVMPRQFTDLFPVRYETETHSVKAYYPKVSIPDHSPRVRFHRIEPVSPYLGRYDDADFDSSTWTGR